MSANNRLNNILLDMMRNIRAMLDEYDRDYLILDNADTLEMESKLVHLLNAVASETHIKLPETYVLHYTDGLGVVRDIKIGKNDVHLYARESYMILSHKINNMIEEN